MMSHIPTLTKVFPSLLYPLPQNGNPVVPLSTNNIQVFKDRMFLSDLAWRRESHDFVLPIGPSAELLAYMTIRKPIDSALDLGCGCGVQAILAADHARSVIATDINPRALEFTAMNARLNGFNNIHTGHGSYFEPVHGQRFDLILINMPYVISPQNKYLYRDMVSTNGSDSINLAKQIPNHLKANGFAHINLSWIFATNEEPWQPLMEVIQNTGLDGMLFLAADFTPERYAEFWLSADGSLVKREKVNEYASWYRNRGMEHIALGHLILRSRKTSKNWFTVFGLNTRIQKDVGEKVEQLFCAQDQLEAMGTPEDLLDVVFHQTGIQIISSGDDKTIAEDQSDFKFQIPIHSATAQAIKCFNGKKSAREALLTAGCESITSAEFLREIQLLLQFGMIQKMKD